MKKMIFAAAAAVVVCSLVSWAPKAQAVTSRAWESGMCGECGAYHRADRECVRDCDPYDCLAERNEACPPNKGYYADPRCEDRGDDCWNRDRQHHGHHGSCHHDRERYCGRNLDCKPYC